MAKKKRKPVSGQKIATTLAALLFLAAAVYGAVKCFVRPPELPQDPQQEQKDAQNNSDPQQGQQTETDQNLRKKGYYTILLCGTDDDNGGTDTNILVSVDTEAGKVYGVSLPRDTLLDTQWKTKKLNHSYNVGGIPELRKQIHNLLGVPVDYYVQVDLKAFVKLVDTIKGVDFDVPLDMDYDDPAQELSIHFKKGMQHLDGADALRVVRFRHNNDGTGYGTEDIGRIGTQQAFLKTVAKKMLQPENLTKVGSYVDIFQEYVKTDLTNGNMVWLAQQVFTIGVDNIEFHTLPGDGTKRYLGRSYYVLDPEKTLEMVNQCLNPYQRQLSLKDMDILSVE